MFTGPVGPVEVFFYWPEAVLGNFYWPGAIGSPLMSSPVSRDIILSKYNHFIHFQEIARCSNKRVQHYLYHLYAADKQNFSHAEPLDPLDLTHGLNPLMSEAV